MRPSAVEAPSRSPSSFGGVSTGSGAYHRAWRHGGSGIDHGPFFPRAHDCFLAHGAPPVCESAHGTAVVVSAATVHHRLVWCGGALVASGDCALLPGGPG